MTTSHASAADFPSGKSKSAAEPPLTGLVLAGGGSRRMGRDKALVEVNGRRLIDIAVGVLRDCCVDVAVAAREQPIAGLDVRVVDDAEGEGPLAGIVAGLRAARTPLVAVLGVDMPLASAAVFRRLAAAHAGEAAVVPRAGGVIQPLHAVYARDAAEDLAALLARGERSPRVAIEVLGGRVLEPVDYDPEGTAGAFWANVNSPADLHRLPSRPAVG